MFVITALFMIPGLITTLMVSEPALAHPAPRTLADAIVLPFREFITRHGVGQALLILAFIFLYKLGDSMATALATPFYLDIGFTKSEIGLIAKNAALWPSVIGGLLGGLWMVKIGINRALWLFGLVQLASILGFAWLAYVHQPDRVLLALVIGASRRWAWGWARRRSSPSSRAPPIHADGDAVCPVHEPCRGAALGGQRVDRVDRAIGWFDFYLLCTVLALPGMALLWWVAPWNERLREQ